MGYWEQTRTLRTNVQPCRCFFISTMFFVWVYNVPRTSGAKVLLIFFPGSHYADGGLKFSPSHVYPLAKFSCVLGISIITGLDE